MYNVLIVDDEPIHRRGLTNMIKELRPDYCINNAKNGLEALEYILNNQIDILITDIKMPVMDGLKLIESMGKKAKEIKIIILSVYGWFEYAQKAINLGALDYILKPVDSERVNDVLIKAEQKIYEERKAKYAEETLKTRLDSILPDYIEYKLNKLLYGQLLNDEIDEIKSVFPCSNKGIVIIYELDNNGALKTCNSQSGLIINIKRFMNSMVDPSGSSIIFSLQGGAYNIVEIKELPDGIFNGHERINQYISYVEKNFGIKMTAGIGSIYDDFINGVKDSFKNADSALKFKFYHEYGKVIRYDDIKIKSSEIFISNMTKQSLSSYILKMDKDNVKSIIDGIFDDMAKDGYFEPVKAVNFMAGIMREQIKTIQNEYKAIELQGVEGNVTMGLNNCGSFEELRQIVYKGIFDIIDLLAVHKSNRNSYVIEMCKKYIEEHYMEDISLDQVAEMFRFNPSYFSNFFKNQSNIGFCEYLLNVRMGKAKELLKNNKYKVYQVANLVGYQDSKYFIRLFKKEFGFTPEQYRCLK